MREKICSPRLYASDFKQLLKQSDFEQFLTAWKVPFNKASEAGVFI